MPFIFLSYSHKDSEYANRLADSLEAKGLEVWIDERIDYGARWSQAIQENVDRCAAFVVVMTTDSFESAWVQNELAYAMSKRKPIFPVHLAGPIWLAVSATQVAPATDGRLPPTSFYTRLAGVLSGSQATLSTGLLERLHTELDELQRRYDNLTSRIAAVDTDLRRELDSERRLVLEDRRAELVASREKTTARMAEIEAQLARREEGARVFQPSPKPQKPPAGVVVAPIENQPKRQDQVKLPKGLVDLPQAHERHRSKVKWLPVAGLGGVVVAAVFLFAYMAGVIPPRSTPPPTASSAASVGLPTQAPTLAVTPTTAATDTPLPALDPVGTSVQPTATSAVTSTLLPITTFTHNAVVLPSNRMVITSPISMELVRVPAGEFLMGSDPTKDLQALYDEKPQHSVTLAEFYISKYEVRNDQYAAFVEATGRAAPAHWDSGKMPPNEVDYPVVKVPWDGAVAFTKWLSEQTSETFRLCTEAEWEKACRGVNGFLYPWGDTFDVNNANTAEAGFARTTSVNAYSPAGDSPFGVSDMVGNIWEWVADRYSEDYYQTSPADNPKGPESGDYKIGTLRGGSFLSHQGIARCAYRRYGSDSNLSYDYYGFRVCVSADLSGSGQ